ncbi:MAG: energy-coupling factor transporter transmembrane component T family protein [Planctomycetota bacterium]
MRIFTLTQNNFVTTKLDPRTSMILSLCWALFICTIDAIEVLGICVYLPVMVSVIFEVPGEELISRVKKLNLFLVFLVPILVLSYQQGSGYELAGIFFSKNGFIHAIQIILKANSIMLFFSVFVSFYEPVMIGKALKAMKVSDKFIFLLLFTVRYIDTIHKEYHRLRDAMKIRSFEPDMSRRTMKVFGTLVGQILLRSLERSNKILNAMKCRGFEGKFYLPANLKLSKIDLYALFVFLLSIGVLFWMS